MLILNKNAIPQLQITISKIDLMSRPLLSPVGEIGSGYPTNVYDCNKLLLPILRQKMAQYCGMMFIDLPDGCRYEVKIPGIHFEYQNKKH
jgi:hypothetical protein